MWLFNWNSAKEKKKNGFFKGKTFSHMWKILFCYHIVDLFNWPQKLNALLLLLVHYQSYLKTIRWNGVQGNIVWCKGSENTENMKYPPYIYIFCWKLCKSCYNAFIIYLYITSFHLILIINYLDCIHTWLHIIECILLMNGSLMNDLLLTDFVLN